MGTKKPDDLTLEEYIALEKESGQRFEYHNGYVVAMAGGTLIHGRLCSRVNYLLQRDLNSKACEVLNSEVKIFLSHSNSFVYPDGMAICDELQPTEDVEGAIINPVIIVEVFSESSEKYDRGQKFHKYRRLSSFQNYVLVAQDKMYVEVWYRPPGADLWRIDIYEGEEAQAHLQSVDIQLSLSELYSPVKEQLELAAKKAAEVEKS
ncbi:MAG: Uma2 family endonuclease [Bacteroidota bacterium]